MKVLVVVATLAIAAAAISGSGDRLSSGSSLARMPDGPRVTVWGSSGSATASGIDVVAALESAAEVEAPTPAPFYTVEVPAPGCGGRLYVYFAPTAAAVAGNSDERGLVWLRLDARTAHALGTALSRLAPYRLDGRWPLGLKSPYSLRQQLACLDGNDVETSLS